MATAKNTTRKTPPSGAPTKPGKSIKQVPPLDRNDPRVRAIVAEILGDASKNLEARIAERKQKAARAVDKRKAKFEAEKEQQAKKRKSRNAILSRLTDIAEPLQAIHDSAEAAFMHEDHETTLVVVSNLSMICLKRLEDCLVDMGGSRRGHGDAWLAGEMR